ncbi:MAG: adenylate/guanylate cyclase domain-containing protein [Cellvibrionaceae bacterium]
MSTPTTSQIDGTPLQAIMFADVSGSSALYKRQGNLKAKQLIDTAINLMKTITMTNTGFVVKTIGDEVMARFNTPEDACRAASEIQQQCSLATANEEEQGLAIRIGMDFGQTVLDDNDIFGDTVNDAAHVAHIARPNQIVITQSMVDALSPNFQEQCQEFDRIKIKGEAKKSLIYRFVWEQSNEDHSATMVMAINHITQKIDANILQLDYNNKRMAVSSETLPFIIGRDHRIANLHIDSSLASRDHCHIVMQRGKFVLVDHSTNGTYIKGPDQPEIYLRREQLPLIGEGTISIGRRAAQAPELTITYSL